MPTKTTKNTESPAMHCTMCGSPAGHCHCGKGIALFGLVFAVLGALLIWGRYPWFTLTNVVGVVLILKGLKKFAKGLHGGCH